MRKFTKELYQNLQLSIQDISNTGMTGFDYYKSCYQETMEASKKLKSFILNYRFSDEAEEIEFFKEIKPRFQSKLMYFTELIQVEIQKPLLAEKRMLLKYYRRSSSHYTALANKNQIFLHYVRSQIDIGDHHLFVRSGGSFDFIPNDLDLDDKYSTPGSNELSKLLSYEMVLDHLAQKIQALSTTKTSEVTIPQHRLTWTGRSAALIELAYGLQSVGAINNGTASVSEIVAALEYIFNTDTGKFYRVFQNIRIRKGSRTIFLDEVIAKLIHRMDETDLHGKNWQ
ncbi:hypothetical protein SF1_18930 [Sphingobacterium faecium NBRC 15299]|uniref:RteC domain-containing protein n=1 Tax=Sphingobacterium faecium TaxID=34087 RepID=UPI000D398640|nr:RteC domain-containing protein [Sphingobacterium faecium]PTX09466.1 RteC protein [Sphingobacterium faecium]GEM63911.1 hypothetical protein SF1_18930 [Sphingobacterium faecium NBRC 15299]